MCSVNIKFRFPPILFLSCPLYFQLTVTYKSTLMLLMSFKYLILEAMTFYHFIYLSNEQRSAGQMINTWVI